MLSFQNPLTGQSYLKETLKPYVTQTSLEQQFQDFEQDVETGTFLLPNTTDYFLEKPPSGNINLNGKKITNLDTSVDFSQGLAALAGTATSIIMSTVLHPNTGPQNLTAEASYGNKRLTNMSDAQVITQNDVNIEAKKKQGVNQGFMLENTVSYGLRKANDGTDDVLQISGAFSAFKAGVGGNNPTIIQGVKDPERDFDAVNKRSTIVEDEKQVEDPLTHTLYDRLQVGDRVLQLRDTLDPLIPPVPGTDFATMVGKQAITKSYADGKFHKKNMAIDFGNNKGINCTDPTASQDVVTKHYCDTNSKNNDGTGLLTDLLGGALGGAISSALVTSIGQGLNTFGQITGSLVGGTAALSTALKVGDVTDFNRAVPGVGESQQLIDNVKSDIANGGPGAAPGGGLFNGPLSVSGLFSAVRNAQIGLFDI